MLTLHLPPGNPLFPGEPSLGVQLEEAELEVRHQGGSSAALPAQRAACQRLLVEKLFSELSKVAVDFIAKVGMICLQS